MNFSLTRKLLVAIEGIESALNQTMPEGKSDPTPAADSAGGNAVSLFQDRKDSAGETLAESRESFRHSWDSAEGYVATNPWRSVASLSLSGRIVGTLLSAGHRY